MTTLNTLTINMIVIVGGPQVTFEPSIVPIANAGLFGKLMDQL